MATIKTTTKAIKSVAQPPPQLMMLVAIGVLFMVIGYISALTAVFLELSEFSPLQEKYWSIDKATRDSAETGSEISNMLVKIQQFPPKLMTLKLVGIAHILVGIFIVLAAIIKALAIMPVRLGTILCPKCGIKLTIQSMPAHMRKHK